MCDDDMVRFVRHARRVRVLKNIQPKRAKACARMRYSLQGVLPTIDEVCFGILHTYFKERPALPNLRRLTCDHDDIICAEHLGLFLSPALRALKFRRTVTKYSIHDISDELTKRGCTDALEVLQLDEASHPRSSELEKSGTGMEFLARLPRLRRLGIFFDLSEDYRTILQCLPPGSFPSLQQLKVEGGRVRSWRCVSDGDTALKTIADFLNYFAPTHPLRSLHVDMPVDLDNVVSQQAIRALFEAVAAFEDTLDILTIFLGSSLRDDEAPLTRSIFEPLMSCWVSGIVMDNMAFDIDLADLEAMRDTWPALYCLGLGQQSTLSSAHISAASLPGFVSGARSLEKLGVQVYDSGERLGLEVAEKQANLRLRVLDAGYSLVHRDRIREVAAYLSCSFPSSTPTFCTENHFSYLWLTWHAAVKTEQLRWTPEIS